MEETAGQILKRVREQKNLSFEDVYAGTKIHIDVLKDIEQDKFDRLGPIYTKSFLRLYADFLGADTASIIKLSGLDDATNPNNSLKKYKTSTSKKKLEFKLPKINKKTIILAVSVLSIYILGLVLVKTIASNKSPSVDSNITEPVNDAAKESVKKEDKKPTAAVKSSSEENLEPIRLGIKAKNNCWLKVVVDGQVVLRGVLKKNKVENWQAKELIELSIGDASLVNIEVNGKMIAPLGRKGQAIKSIEITSDGLVVNN